VKSRDRKDISLRLQLPLIIRILFAAIALGTIIPGSAMAVNGIDRSGDNQTDLVLQVYSKNITWCEYLEITNAEKLRVLQQTVSEKTYQDFCVQPVFWGDNDPSLPYGADIWNDDGPLNMGALNETEKRNYGIEHAIIGGEGYRILDFLNWQVKYGEPVSFQRRFPSGMEVVTFDLNWINPESSLKITVFGPDCTAGPYHDESDGKADGRIFLELYREENITGGDWYAVIDAEKVSGDSQPFRLLFY